MTEQSGAANQEPLPQAKRKQTPEEIVRRLQARIVKAQEQGKHNKVKALQYLLNLLPVICLLLICLLFLALSTADGKGDEHRHRFTLKSSRRYGSQATR